MMKKSVLIAVVLAFTLFLGIGVKGAQADSILFPYLTTEAGKFSFVTIANEGLREFATLTGYHLTYGHKPVPVVQRRGCNHFDGPITSTPADMLTFEVGGKVLDAGSTVLFEGGPPVTSTALPLPVANQIAFLIVEPLGNTLAAETNTNIEVWGWAEVIDTVANMTLAYSTHNFGVNDSTDPSFALSNVGNTWHRISWYPTQFVTTSWHVLPLGLRSAMAPGAGGGLRMTLSASNGVLEGAYDRDEQFWSGMRTKTIRCFGIINRADLLQPAAIVMTENGGFLYAESFATVTLPLTDPDDPGGTYIPTQHLIHKIQTATAAAGVGTRTAINREPALNPNYDITLDVGP